jgi:hypothetical protein
MSRSLSATFITAQQAVSNTPYFKLLFTSHDGLTTVDLSSDSSTYGDRIQLIDHSEEAYDDYATIILRNEDRLIPNLKGYWVEIGYGYVTTAGNEYLGDGTNEPAPPRLWVKHQQVVSVAGNLYVLLELEGMWAKLRETVMRLGSPPYYIYQYTASTIYDIIGYVLTECGMTLEALVEDDGIIDSLTPSFDINAQPFEYAAAILYRLIYATKSYLKPLDSMRWEIKYPQDSDTVNHTYYSWQEPVFFEYTERTNVLAHNHILVFGNQGSDGLWTNIKVSDDSTYGIDADEIAAYGDVYKIVLAGSLTTQAEVNARADAIITREQYEQQAGRLYIPHDAGMELYDRIEVQDLRGVS